MHLIETSKLMINITIPMECKTYRKVLDNKHKLALKMKSNG